MFFTGSITCDTVTATNKQKGFVGQRFVTLEGAFIGFVKPFSVGQTARLTFVKMLGTRIFRAPDSDDALPVLQTCLGGARMFPVTLPLTG